MYFGPVSSSLQVWQPQIWVPCPKTWDTKCDRHQRLCPTLAASHGLVSRVGIDKMLGSVLPKLKFTQTKFHLPDSSRTQISSSVKTDVWTTNPGLCAWLEVGATDCSHYRDSQGGGSNAEDIFFSWMLQYSVAVFTARPRFLDSSEASKLKPWMVFPFKSRRELIHFFLALTLWSYVRSRAAPSPPPRIRCYNISLF